MRLFDRDKYFSNVLRPTKFSEFVGQQETIELLQATKQAVDSRKDVMPHVLLSGPPGLGKTTIANLIKPDKSKLHTILGASVSEEILTPLFINARDGDVIFIDEVHSSKKQSLEILYSILEDNSMHCINGSFILKSRATIVAATTDAGKLPIPFKDRFELHPHLRYYTEQELETIAEAMADKLNFRLSPSDRKEIAARSRGTPRLCGNYLKRLRDIGDIASTWRLLQIYDRGLTALDIALLTCIVNVHGGGPVGVKLLANTYGGDEDELTKQIEPWLLRLGLLEVTTRGRRITTEGLKTLALLPL